jgi:hypothetical protein
MKRCADIYVEHDPDRYSGTRLVFIKLIDYYDYVNLEYPYLFGKNGEFIKFKKIKLNDQLFTCTIINILKL